MISLVRRSPAKPKDVAPVEKSELEKHLENVQNVPGTSQVTKQPKPGQFMYNTTLHR